MMDPVAVIQGRMAPLPRANVDTDQIIPKQFLKRVERTGFGPFLFWDWARDHEGEPDPEFVLNRPEFEGAVVLVTGPNFGCGSSREHAPWAIQQRGFRAVVAPSFGDIFRHNCYNIGLLPVVLEPGEVERLIELAANGGVTTIDLEAQTVEADGFSTRFDIDPVTKDHLLRGLDAIELTLSEASVIDVYEQERLAFRPKVG